MLQAAVHSTYRREGSGETSRARWGGASPFRNGSFSGQSPQKVEPPPFRSRRSDEARSPVQTAETPSRRASPSTRLPYGSAQPQTRRPSQSSTIVDQGHEQAKRVAR